SQARPSPQPGQTNPCGQRRSKRYSAHSLSLAKRPWNSINDFGNRPSDPDIAFPRPSQTEGSYLHVPVLYTTFRRTRLSYISLNARMLYKKCGLEASFLRPRCRVNGNLNRLD